MVGFLCQGNQVVKKEKKHPPENTKKKHPQLTHHQDSISISWQEMYHFSPLGSFSIGTNQNTTSCCIQGLWLCNQMKCIGPRCCWWRLGVGNGNDILTQCIICGYKYNMTSIILYIYIDTPRLSLLFIRENILLYRKWHTSQKMKVIGSWATLHSRLMQIWNCEL